MTMFKGISTAVGASFPNLKLESTNKSFHLSDYLGRQNVVLHFVCHFSCSRCWRSVMRLKQLNPWLQGLNISALVIGRGDHLYPASQLAHDLNIPFPLLITASDAFYSVPDGCDVYSDSHFSATVLLDTNGIVRHSQFTHSPTATLDINALLAAAAYLCAQQVKTTEFMGGTFPMRMKMPLGDLLY